MRNIAGIVLFLIAAATWADEYPACAVAVDEIHEIYPGQFIRAVATIKGAPCFESTLTIELSSKRKVIYAYSARFKPHSAIPWESLTAQDAERFAKSAVSADRFINCADLEPAQDDPIYVIPAIPQKRYEEIRASECRAFQHNTHYEAGVSVLLPASLNEAIKVNEYGV